MAKSPVGGSRAMLKGRIGSDVYSVGKDGKGRRQQVVRSLAEQVSNPRTQAQMEGRMIMSTVMQAVAGLSAIIDHSFDGIANGQPSISEFIRRNYALVKADIAAHPSSGNKFGINKYQQKGALPGVYVLSNGTLEVSGDITLSDSGVYFPLSEAAHTVGDLKALLGISADGYFTIVAIGNNSGVDFTRFQVNPALADTTEITAANVGTLFVTEGSSRISAGFDSNMVSFEPVLSNDDQSLGLIFSDKVAGQWKHSSSVMKCSSSPDNKASVALPTYPVGTEQFLNGGDL